MLFAGSFGWRDTARQPSFFAGASFLLYIESMRLVTRKPPKMFMEAIVNARNPKILATTLSVAVKETPTASSAPTTMTEEIALVTLLSGVCRAGVTDQTTK